MMRYSAKKLRDLFVVGEITAEAIAAYYVKRIETLDPMIGAFLTTFATSVQEQARALDKKRADGQPLGKLAALPIALKDNMHVSGELTTCGSRFLKNYRAPFDATVTRLIKEQDGLIVGKTNLDEFAMGSSSENSAFQITRNPWALDCVPGGSSGGSAAAVAARLSPLALGSDTGGSIRQPAALCGLVGFKPTYGRVSRYGLVAFASSLDQIGPLATTVEDIALIMEVIGQHCEKDSTSLARPPEPFLDHLERPIKGKRIGVPWSSLESLEEEIATNFKESLALFKEQGAEIVSVDLNLLKYSIACYSILSTAEASTNLARFDGIRYGVRSQEAKSLDEVYDLSREEGFGPEVKNRILLGTFVLSSGYQEAFYKKAQKVRTLYIEQFNHCFSSCDFIALPTAPKSAFPLGTIHTPLEMYLQDIFTIPASLAGLPAISIPSGFTKEGKPIGLQLIAPLLHDSLLLSCAHAVETERILPPRFNQEAS